MSSKVETSDVYRQIYESIWNIVPETALFMTNCKFSSTKHILGFVHRWHSHQILCTLILCPKSHRSLTTGTKFPTLDIWGDSLHIRDTEPIESCHGTPEKSFNQPVFMTFVTSFAYFVTRKNSREQSRPQTSPISCRGDDFTLRPLAFTKAHD